MARLIEIAPNVFRRYEDAVEDGVVVVGGCEACPFWDVPVKECVMDGKASWGEGCPLPITVARQRWVDDS